MTLALGARPVLSRIRTGRAPLYLLCLAFVVLLTATALLAPWLAPHDPNAVDLGNAMAAPTGNHLLGVDASGRDTLSRLLVGARTSLLGPLGVVLFSTVAGVAVGAIAGWYLSLIHI